MTDLRRHVRELHEGARIFASRQLWHAFRDYWRADAISARLDAWTSRFRDQTDQEPDWKLEHRIAKRRAEDHDEDLDA